jgi:hypothetical protein
LPSGIPLCGPAEGRIPPGSYELALRAFASQPPSLPASQHNCLNLSAFNTDVSVKSQKINLLSFRRKPESSHFNSFWTPAFAGVTGLGLFTNSSIITFKK